MCKHARTRLLMGCLAHVLIWLPAATQAQVLPTWAQLGPYDLAGQEPRDRVVDDLNGDGFLDIALACGEAAIVLGDGTGSFADDRDFQVVQGTFDPAPWGICSGDFNGDGKRDLAFTLGAQFDGLGQPNHKIEVFTGLGDGEKFAHAGTLMTSGTFPIDCDVADVDEDGRDDIVAICNKGGIDVFRGLGAGSFAPPLAVSGAPSNGIRIAHADVDGDGHVDLIASYAGTFPVRYLFFGAGNAVFSATDSVVLGAGSSNAIADVDADGRLDLVTTAVDKLPNYQGGLRVFRNLGGRQFDVLGPFGPPLSMTPYAGDFNRDGIVDMAVVGAALEVYLGVGDGTFFDPVSTVAIPAVQPAGAAAGDWNGDGHADLAVPDRNLGQSPFIYSYMNTTVPGPWTFLGLGLEGTGLPLLQGAGDFSPGSTLSLEVTGAPASALGALIIGAVRIDQPFLGGTLVPAPDLLLILPTNAGGSLSLSASNLPAGLSGLSFYFQYWVTDVAGPLGYAASNGLRGTAP